MVNEASENSWKEQADTASVYKYSNLNFWTYFSEHFKALRPVVTKERVRASWVGGGLLDTETKIF